MPFGADSFADLIFGKPELWPDSPALGVWATFGGRTLLVLPEHDEAIPQEMAALIQQRLHANPQVTTMRLAGAGHLLDHWLAEHPADRQAVISGLCSLAR